MSASISELKKVLRSQVRLALKNLTSEARAEASARACVRLQEQPAWSQAKVVLGFAPMDEELNIWPVLSAGLAQGKILCLPRYNASHNSYEAYQVLDLRSDLCSGHFEIREPAGHCPAISLNQLDFILVPGVAYDADGRRLGRGKGYYDQILAAVRGTKCGVAFDEQIVDAVPVEPHDIYLDCILTPTRWLLAGRRSVL